MTSKLYLTKRRNGYYYIGSFGEPPQVEDEQVHHEIRCTTVPSDFRGDEEGHGTNSPSLGTDDAVRDDA
jgi:hypothetical protein